jgi:23S rRNA (cytidine1920-2'-O)/16S rRNA (cytidine1409-2'-O)-methyltransferase
LDKLLVNRGLALSRERAQALILAGKVLVNEQKIEKPGTPVAPEATLRLLGADLRYVSRGGLKLEAALRHWRIDVRGWTCLDIGASTGGFTDCLLQQGAAHIIAVDTGYGQMDYQLRQDARVRLLEKTNARYLTAADVKADIDFVAVDVSFISATLVLPAVIPAAGRKDRVIETPSGDRVIGRSDDPVIENAEHRLNAKSRRPVIRNLQSCPSDHPITGSSDHPMVLVVLVKPQFEAGREHVHKGGIVRDPAIQAAAVEKVRSCVQHLGAGSTDVIDSPILGQEGNREFLLFATF